MPLVGLDNLYYAVQTADTSSGVSYLTPVKIANAINVKVDAKQNTEILYADNGPSEAMTALGEITVEIEAADISIADQATLLGHTIANGTIVRKATDVSPYVAIGFKSKKSNGSYRYSWILKGKFEETVIENATSEDKPKFQTPKLKGTFIMRTFDSSWSKMADEDNASYVTSVGTNWFTAVESAADTTAPTLSSTLPANSATTVAVSSTYRWTFSEAILPSTVVSGNFFLIKDTDGSIVAGTLTQSADKTFVTFTPTANLTAATVYRAIVTSDVTDYSGNKLANPIVYKFTTA